MAQQGLAYGVIGRDTYVSMMQGKQSNDGFNLDIPTPPKVTEKNPLKGGAFDPKLNLPNLDFPTVPDVNMLPKDYALYNTMSIELNDDKRRIFDYISTAQEIGTIWQKDTQAEINKMMTAYTMKSTQVAEYMQVAKQYATDFKTDVDYFTKEGGKEGMNLPAMTAGGSFIYNVQREFVNNNGVKFKSYIFVPEENTTAEERDKNKLVTVSDYLTIMKAGYANPTGGVRNEYMPLFKYDVKGFREQLSSTIDSPEFKNRIGNAETVDTFDRQQLLNSGYEYVVQQLGITPIENETNKTGGYLRNGMSANGFNIIKALVGTPGDILSQTDTHSKLNEIAQSKIENKYNITFNKPTAEELQPIGGLDRYIKNEPDTFLQTAESKLLQTYKPADFYTNKEYRNIESRVSEDIKVNSPNVEKAVKEELKLQGIDVSFYNEMGEDSKAALYTSNLSRKKDQQTNWKLTGVVETNKYYKYKSGYNLTEKDMDSISLYGKPITKSIFIGGAINTIMLNGKNEDGEVINDIAIVLKASPTSTPHIIKSADGTPLLSTYILVSEEKLKTLKYDNGVSIKTIDTKDATLNSLGIKEVKNDDPITINMIQQTMKQNIAYTNNNKPMYDYSGYYIVPAYIEYNEEEIRADVQKTEEGRKALRIQKQSKLK